MADFFGHTHLPIDGVTVAIKHIEIAAEPIRVESITPEIDPTWVYRDEKGHWHYIAMPDTSERTPTMVWVYEDPDDEESDGWWQCQQCREKLHPASRMPQPTMIPGRRTIRIDVEMHEWVKAGMTLPEMMGTQSLHIVTFGDGSVPVHLAYWDGGLVRLIG